MASSDRDRVLSSPGIWKDVVTLLRAHRVPLTGGLLLILVGRAAGFMIPASSKWLIDTVIGKHRWDLLPVLAATIAAASLLEGGSAWLLARVLGLAGQMAVAETRKAVHAHVTTLPISFFGTTHSGDLVSRIVTDPEGLRYIIGTAMVQLIGALIAATVALGVLFYLNWTLTLLILLLLASFTCGTAAGARALDPLFSLRMEIAAGISGRLGERLRGIRTVKVFAAHRREQRVFAEDGHHLVRIVAKSLTGAAAANAAGNIAIGVLGMAVIAVGGAAVGRGSMTAGDLVMYFMFTGTIAAPLTLLASSHSQIGEAAASLRRIQRLRLSPPERVPGAAAVPITRLVGDVEFDNVGFAYESNRPILYGLSFHASRDSTTAIVGASGAGKTTIGSLLLGFMQPTCGSIRVDGLDLAMIRPEDYRRHVAVVLQDDFLFDATILTNLAYGRPEASRHEARAAARLAHCDDFIERLPEQYDTVVGTRGVRLSGGQRQRLMIARAFLTDARILILDEPTSSLDPENEALVAASLETLRRNRTTFLIAHRLWTVRSADLILVLDGGRVVEQGRHDQLWARRGLYWRMWSVQDADNSARPMSATA